MSVYLSIHILPLTSSKKSFNAHKQILFPVVKTVLRGKYVSYNVVSAVRHQPHYTLI